MQPDDFPPGTVWLVGAGPGDPELLTMKAVRLIERAEIVFYDALVGEGVLALIPAGTERVSVGKRSGRHSKDQPTIDALLVAAARSGKRVARLKGGDPTLFARAAEEISALSEAGFAVRICPAHSGSTLAFYMGRDAAGEIMRGLMRAGMSGETPVMIACHVSGADERRLATRLDLLELATGSFAADAPTLILVGAAVGLADVACASLEAIARTAHG